MTGHRADALASVDVSWLRTRVADALALLRSEALAILRREAAFFSGAPPAFTLVSPLASGADQMVAEAAIATGWALQAVLPFRYEDCRREQDSVSAASLDVLRDAASCVLELPGDPDDPPSAFALAGRATVAHCDLLLAVWDGLPGRGRGGTAHTVEMALLRGTPILHLPVDPAQQPRLLWSAFDPAVITHPGNHGEGRPATFEAIGQVLTAILAPPPSAAERKFLRRFLSERPYRWNWRIEYPLLMALAGAHRMSRRDFRTRNGVILEREEWNAYRHECACHGVGAELDRLEEAYGWADRLGSHFSQTYRSSHVFNFLLAATGALIGLSGLVADFDPLPAAAAEFAIILAVVANTLFGSRRCWHQRWLDYRQLAERLRPMRSLKLLGIASPDPPGSAAEPIAGRWIEWYAAGMWRTVGCPSGNLSAAGSAALAAAIARRELDPQIAYHRHSATQSQRFDDRLEFVGLSLFIITILISLGVIVALEVAPGLVGDWSNWITFFSAGLPAVGTAIFGIRVQGDFGNVAARCQSTAALLRRVSDELSAGPSLERAADLTEQAGRIMLQDLDQWRLVVELHELSVG